jgi:hypothetical protein
MQWAVRIFLVAAGLLVATYSHSWLAIVGIVLFLVGLTGPSLRVLFSARSLETEALSKPVSDKAVEPEQTRDFSSGSPSAHPKHGFFLGSMVFRRAFFWFMEGGLVFWLFVWFTVFRFVFIQGNQISLVSLAARPGVITLILVIFLTAITASLPFGYILNQLYFVSYWVANLPIRFSQIDRVYDALLTLENRYSVDFKEFDVSAKGLQNTSVEYKRLRLRLFLGPEAYFTPKNSKDLLPMAQRNWMLFNNLWHQLLPKDQFDALEELAGWKEDGFVLMRVARISDCLGWGLYALYEIIHFNQGTISFPELASALLSSFAIAYIIFVGLNITRANLGADSIAFKFSHMSAALKLRAMSAQLGLARQIPEIRLKRKGWFGRPLQP